MSRRSISCLAALLVCAGNAVADDAVTVAVASNFWTVAWELADMFQRETGASVRLTMASTGKLYAHVVNGATIDVLLAADVDRPRLLEEQGIAVARFTYAIGALVVWSRMPMTSGNCLDALRADDPGRIAIANPAIAPYGAAAQEVMVALGLWERHRQRIVMGENISQTMSFVATGNASLGFVAPAQLTIGNLPEKTCEWRVPPDMHAPIEQQAALLARASENAQARAFFEFLRGPDARRAIADAGYRLPD